MKKHFLLGLLACAFIACDNQESNDSVSCETTIVKYVYKGIEYDVEMRELNDGSFEEVSEMSPELEQAFLLPAPYFVQDSLDDDKFYIYDSVPEITDICENKTTIEERKDRHYKRSYSFEEEDYIRAGHVYTYDEANQSGRVCYTFTVRESDFDSSMKINGKSTNFWGVRYLSLYGVNDKISSIYVYANRSGKKSDYYKIRFYEDDNFKGACIDFKCEIMDMKEYDPMHASYLCDKQDNLKKVIRKKRKLRSNLMWNNCISSFYYYYVNN